MNDEYTCKNYWEFIKTTAEEIAQEYEEDNNLDVNDKVHEAADQSRWCFVYYGAQRALEHSDNEEAWDEAYSDFSELAQGCNSINELQACMAYFAICADINNHLPAMY